MRVLFLDIDGVLTSAHSRRQRWDAFDPAATSAFRYLLAHGKPDRVVVHSSWRKLPEPPGYTVPLVGGGHAQCAWASDHSIWFELCRQQGLSALADVPHEDCPYKYSSHRGHEINMWLSNNADPANRYVVLDDYTDELIRETVTYAHPAAAARTCFINTSDARGLHLDEATRAVAHWTGA